MTHLSTGKGRLLELQYELSQRTGFEMKHDRLGVMRYTCAHLSENFERRITARPMV